jgi:hypothetical protein
MCRAHSLFPSANMPSTSSTSKYTYTKSTATSESYAGNRGKLVLLHAIELLFFIKSAEFRKFHPSFITPSAEEFLDYIQSRYRKYIAIPSMRHRPLHITPTPKPPILFKQFLVYIQPSAAKSSIQSVIGCLYIVVESLSLYFLIKSLATGDSWRDEYGSSTFFEHFNAPIYWLLEHKMSSCFTYRQDILTKITNFLSKKTSALLSEIPSTSTNPTKQSMLETLSQQYISAFQTVFTDDMYTMYFVAPFSFLFGTHGVPSCKEFCEEIVKKYSDLRIVC